MTEEIKNLTDELEDVTNGYHYILDEQNNVVPCSLMTWSRFLRYEHDKRIVKQENVNDKWVSTVFMGFDHNYRWLDEKPYKPHIFETMVFNSEDDLTSIYGMRCSTWQEALECHANAIQWVKNGCKEDE